jgi:hypothetical protein
MRGHFCIGSPLMHIPAVLAAFLGMAVPRVAKGRFGPVCASKREQDCPKRAMVYVPPTGAAMALFCRYQVAPFECLCQSSRRRPIEPERIYPGGLLFDGAAGCNAG